MSAAIVVLDLEEIPRHLEVDPRHDRALLLLRSKGRYVGRHWCRVSEGYVDLPPTSRPLLESASWAYWEAELEGFLEWDVRSSGPLPPSTVAVCTRDRTAELSRCLDALRRLPDHGQEILVVDNCPSTESTRQLVSELEGIRYVREERPGLDVARNRALREARCEIVAFADDDTSPDQGWLSSLLCNFDDPRIACVTGLTLPAELETEAQVDFERFTPFARGYARRVYSRHQLDPLAAGRVGAGANMAVRRSLLAEVGPFDERLDAGTPTMSGGDTEMFSRILDRGYRIVFEPMAVSWHRHARTQDAVRRCVYGYGVGTYAFWTQRLLAEGEWRVVLLAASWLLRNQLPRLAGSVLPIPGRAPRHLCWAELRGCWAGPRAYLASCRNAADA